MDLVGIQASETTDVYSTGNMNTNNFQNYEFRFRRVFETRMMN